MTLLASPEPTDTLQKVLWWVRKIRAMNKAGDQPYVFEYNEYVPKDKAFLMDRNQFEDMRYRVFLAPEWEPLIEQQLKEMELT